MSSLKMSFKTSLSVGLLVGFILSCFALPIQAAPVLGDGEQRSIGEYRRDVKTFMKLSKSEDEQVQRNAVFNLCALHHELVGDSRFRTSTQVQSFRVVVANRLEAFSKERTKEFEKQRLAELKRKRIAERKEKKKKQDLEIETQVLNAPAKTETEQEDQAIFQSALQSYDSLSQFSGGPAEVFDYAGGRLGAPWDHGQQLVDLIQNTIDPASWRDSGGSASIHYYRPGRVLVINGSQRIHEQTEDLLWKLRAAN